MDEELSKEELRDIVKDGGTVVGMDGEPLNLLDRPDEARKSEMRQLNSDLQKFMREFIDRHEVKQSEMIDKLSDLMAKMLAQGTKPQQDFSVVSDSLEEGMRKALSTAMKQGKPQKPMKIKHCNVDVLDTERDPVTGYNEAKRFRITPIFEDAD